MQDGEPYSSLLHAPCLTPNPKAYTLNLEPLPFTLNPKP